MKRINIEGWVALWYDETAISYAQIINCVYNCPTLEDIKDAMRRVLKETKAGKHFVWGYTENSFWLKQRNGYMSSELILDYELTIKFD